MKKGLFMAATSLLIMIAKVDASDNHPTGEQIMDQVKLYEDSKSFVNAAKKPLNVFDIEPQYKVPAEQNDIVTKFDSTIADTTSWKQLKQTKTITCIRSEQAIIEGNVFDYYTYDVSTVGDVTFKLFLKRITALKEITTKKQTDRKGCTIL